MLLYAWKLFSGGLKRFSDLESDGHRCCKSIPKWIHARKKNNVGANVLEVDYIRRERNE